MSIEVRALQPEDVPEASEVAYQSLRLMAQEIHHDFDWPEQRPPERTLWGDYRVAHIQRHDPEGSWVAVDGDEIVGTALATRREDLWFLSLLGVKTGLQAQGIGKQLLDASLLYAEGCKAAWIMSSLDPKAMRRYNQAGFDMHPADEAKGKVDRALIAADSHVRDGDYDRDGELIDSLTRAARGAGVGPDLEAYAAKPMPLLVLEDGKDRGFAILGEGGIYSIGATSDAVAARLFVAAAGSFAQDKVIELAAITANQQWAVSTAHALRLSLVAGASLCTRGDMTIPPAHYIPNGAYG